MTNKEILEIAMRQSAIDANCDVEDLLASENKVVRSVANPEARKYLSLPLFCNLISYGGNIVASVEAGAEDMVRDYIDKYPAAHCFETPSLHVLNDALQKRGNRICFMAEYFLPDVNVLAPRSCGYETKIVESDSFVDLYVPEWENALCEKRKQLDVLGVAAYDGNNMVGLAACSADCETMWQIGVDVLPAYRRQGIATALTSRLAMEILQRDKIPFYCCAWSNIQSVRNAISSGLRPAWVEMTAKNLDFVTTRNR